MPRRHGGTRRRHCSKGLPGAPLVSLSAGIAPPRPCTDASDSCLSVVLHFAFIAGAHLLLLILEPLLHIILAGHHLGRFAATFADSGLDCRPLTESHSLLLAPASPGASRPRLSSESDPGAVVEGEGSAKAALYKGRDDTLTPFGDSCRILQS